MAGPPLVVAVVGPTAVGKTALAIELANRFDGEIINGDSRQVYVGMDIGTAKPTVDERRRAVHHLIDIRDPDQSLSLGEYLPRARDAVEEISSRGRLPIVCGGTGQYVWALLEGWDVPQVPPDPALRDELEQVAAMQGGQALWDRLSSVDPQRAQAINPSNVRRVIRALEISSATDGPVQATRKSAEPPYRPLIIGLTAERTSLYQRIDARFDAMMGDGFLGEVRRLVSEGYTMGEGPLACVGYTQLGQYLDGILDFDEAVARSKTQTHRLVRRQYTWFKPSDPRIKWLDAASDAVPDAARLVSGFLDAPAPYGTIAP